MGNWETVKIDAIVPKEIQQITDAVTTVTQTLAESLRVIKSVLAIGQQFAALATGNPVEAAIKTVIDEIDKLLEDLTKVSVGLNIIAIPIQKQFFGPGVRAPQTSVAKKGLPKFHQLLDDGAFRNRKVTTVPLEVVNFIDSASTATGGNQGFWKALMDSLQDEGDINRPLYPSDTAVVGACLMFGSSDLPTILPNFALLNGLIQLGERADLGSHSRPYPSELSARAFQGSARPYQVTPGLTLNAAAADSPFAVQLTWPSMSPVVTAPLFTSEQFVIVEIFVIRSTDPNFRTKFNWADVFPTQPSSAATDLPVQGLTRVIARLRNDGFRTGYTDAASGLDLQTIYYYATAIRYTVNGVVQPMSSFSNCVRIDPLPRLQSRKSVPPDWFSSPSVYALFPVLENVITEIRAVLAGLRRRSLSTSGLAEIIQQTIRQVDQVIAQTEAVIARIDTINAQITAYTSITLTAALSATTISVDSGGIKSWMSELAKRLSDPTDTSRPPFDTGSELVAGIVIVAGSPSPEKLAPITALLTLLFGGSADNPLLSAINSIEQLAATASAISFNSGMQPGPATESTSASPSGFDATMTPSTNPVC
jgi:hypothetical protein